MGLFSDEASFLINSVSVMENGRVSLFSAIILALNPWHIMNSRATQEVITSFCFFVASLLIFYSRVKIAIDY